MLFGSTYQPINNPTGLTQVRNGYRARLELEVRSPSPRCWYGRYSLKPSFAAMRLYIKNMVCHRCKMVVKAELEKLKLHPVNIALGELIIEEKELDKEQRSKLSDALKNVGFELIDDRRSKLIEQIKTFIINTIHYKDEQPTKNYSELLSQHLHHDYSYLSNLF
jgi:hypothetical protein